MNKTFGWIAVILLAVGAIWYWSVQRDMQSLDAVEVLPPMPAEPLVEEPPPARFPVENIPPPAQPEALEPAPAPEPLPALEDSDQAVLEALATLADPQALEALLVNEFIISRAVATIDSLTSARVAPLMSPLKPVPGGFKVLGSGDTAAISPENSERYQALVDLAGSMDQQRLVALYLRYYPLFQKAYTELGYPDAYFNDRLVEVIDHLLETPPAREMLAVRQNEAVWEFADEQLESLSAGQKMLLRLGPDNQRKAKQWLRDLRAAVTGPGAPAME